MCGQTRGQALGRCRHLRGGRPGERQYGAGRSNARGEAIAISRRPAHVHRGQFLLLVRRLLRRRRVMDATPWHSSGGMPGCSRVYPASPPSGRRILHAALLRWRAVVQASRPASVLTCFADVPFLDGCVLLFFGDGALCPVAPSGGAGAQRPCLVCCGSGQLLGATSTSRRATSAPPFDPVGAQG